MSDPAAPRYFALALTRIAGAALVMFGVVATAGRIEWLPVEAGYVMIALGLLDIAIVPRLLARRWRTPPDR